MVTVKVLTEKNTAALLKKFAPAANELDALSRTEKRKHPGTTKQMLERLVGDIQHIKFRLDQFAWERKERSKKISEATKAGLEKARRRGVKLGGARRKSKVDMRKLLALRKKGMTQQQIAEKMGISQTLVSQRLRGRKR